MEYINEFLAGMFGSSWLEITAAALGFINVYLIIRRSIWNYPFGIAMVILYAVVFYKVGLYAETGLQIYFLIIQCFGLWWWLHGLDQQGLAIVERSPGHELAACTFLAALLALSLGWVLSSYTDASFPYWDSAVASLSVVAQYLLSRRRLENWIVWMMVDVLAIGLYLVKGLYPTAVLYLLFLAMASTGLLAWIRSHERRRAMN